MVGERHVLLAPLAAALLLGLPLGRCLVAAAETAAPAATIAANVAVDAQLTKTAESLLAGRPSYRAFPPAEQDDEGLLSEGHLRQEPVVGLLGTQNSQRGSGENYGKVLSKSQDFAHLPETHPARVHAESRAARRRSFHLVLAGFVLATAYLLSYVYHTSCSGLLIHTERHNFTLNRLSSPSSALFWIVAWRLWLGFVVSGLVSLALNMYQLEKIASKKKRVLPKWFVNHWELLVGVPLLLLLLASGQATQRAAVEAGSAVGSAGGALGKVLSYSGPASHLFFFDMIQQVPLGLAVVGIAQLLATLLERLRQPSCKSTAKGRLTSSSAGSTIAEEDNSRSATFTASGADAELLDDPDSRRQTSVVPRKRSKKDKARRRRMPYFSAAAVSEEFSRAEGQTEAEDPVTPQSTASVRRFHRLRGSQKTVRGRNTSLQENKVREQRRKALEENEQGQAIQEGE